MSDFSSFADIFPKIAYDWTYLKDILKEKFSRFIGFLRISYDLLGYSRFPRIFKMQFPLSRAQFM